MGKAGERRAIPVPSGIMRNVCVFCGSRDGGRKIYVEAAAGMGEAIAEAGFGLVYGGGSTGLMGALADQALAAGGRVVGVIPQAFAGRDFVHNGLDDLRVVGTMHDRKALMAELSDAFIALPGGYGTFEELLEMLTWNQLGFQTKPCGVLNAGGYYDRLLDFLDHAVDEGFLLGKHRERLAVETDARRLVEDVSSGARENDER